MADGVPYAPEYIPNLIRFQRDHVEVETVAAWDANLLAHCSAPVVEVSHAQIPSTQRSVQQVTILWGIFWLKTPD